MENKYINNTRQYRGLGYRLDFNRNAKRFIKKYKTKIGNQLGGTVESMLTRRGQLILMISNAGSGKTYTIMEKMDILSKMEMNDNVRYVIAVPNRNQSNQNEKAYSKFGVKSIVGAKDGKKQIYVDLSLRKFSCVYDKALEVVETLKKAGHEVVLVVDECHKMIADNNFRKEAIANLEEAINMADQSIMMTATPRRNLKYYDFNEIYTFVDEEIQTNIEEFKVLLSDNWRITLFREINKVLNKKPFTVPVVVEKYEDTEEIVEPETLLEMLEGEKTKTVRKTYTEITSKEVPSKVVVRLNSIEEIDKCISILENATVPCERLTSKEKDGEVFQSIEEKSLIESDARVFFVTSVVECGVSLENTEIHLIEVIRKARDFDMDNTVQFFARPRKKIDTGILIVPDYANQAVRESIKEQIKKAKEENKVLDEAELFEKQKKNFATSRIMEDVKKDLAKYEKEIEKIEAMYENMSKRELDVMHKLAEEEYKSLKVRIGIVSTLGDEERVRKYIQDDIINNTKNNPFYIRVLEADLENLEIYIDNKKVVDKAFKEMDKSIVRHNPKMLLNCFENKIFYDKITLEHHYVEQERLTNPELKEQYDDIRKMFTDKNAELKEVKAMREDMARELLRDEEFVAIIDDIRADKIFKDNINEFTTKYSLAEILSFKKTSIYKQFKSLADIFDNNTAVMILTHTVITDKAKTKIYKQALKKNKDLTMKEFEMSSFIVPNKDEIRYLKNTEINDIIERKHIVDNQNSLGKYKPGVADKQAVIMDVVLPAKNAVKSRQARATKDLLLKLNIEMVTRKVYKDAKMEKEIKAIIKSSEKIGTSSDLYSKSNIKKLEAVFSSNNNDVKMLNEISKVFSIVEDTKGFKINNIVKKFDIITILQNIK